jgi:hypothetical protein
MAHARFCAALLLAAALGASGCATCDPEQPNVEPRVGGEIGTGSGGSWSALGVGFDVTNLFCRPPKEEPAVSPPPLAEDALPEPSTVPDPSNTVTPAHE